VHVLDAARLYRLALEEGVAGSTYHAVGEKGVPFRQIAEAIGGGLNIPVKYRPDSSDKPTISCLARQLRDVVELPH